MFKKLFPGWIGKEKKSFKGREEEGGNSREKEEHGWCQGCAVVQCVANLETVVCSVMADVGHVGE